MPTATARTANRAARFFFMHLGSLVAVIVYFTVGNRAGWSVDGVRTALAVALLVKTGYMAVAWRQGELKHFDFALWTLFAVGTVLTSARVGWALHLFRVYSPALVFGAFGVSAIGPLVLGWEPFTLYYARRQTPTWQQKAPQFAAITRVMAAFWGLIFFVAAALCAWAPADVWFNTIFPNLLVFVIGIPAVLWVPPLYSRLVPAPLPESVEVLILGMPFVFDRRAANGASAVFQFHVSGAETGDWWVRVAGRRCKSGEGVDPSADLTVHTPDVVWRRIVHGDMDGGQALVQGLYRIEGNLDLLPKLQDWFRSRR